MGLLVGMLGVQTLVHVCWKMVLPEPSTLSEDEERRNAGWQRRAWCGCLEASASKQNMDKPWLVAAL